MIRSSGGRSNASPSLPDFQERRAGFSGPMRSSTPRTSGPGGARVGRFTVPYAPSGGADPYTGPRTTIAGAPGCGGWGLRYIPGAAYRPFSGGYDFDEQDAS